ncbi:UNVERIFIED_CONTAM: hypothetical protein FKN15_010297 [Acipenser sinensis]
MTSSTNRTPCTLAGKRNTQPARINLFASRETAPVITRWGILFSHPRDFTPVCTTELGRAAKLSGEFARRSVKMIALSIDSVQDHLAWSKDIVAYNGEAADSTLPFPIIADEKRELAIQLGMLDPDEKDKDGIPVTARCVSDTTPNPLSRCRDGSKTPPAQRFHPFQESVQCISV